MTVVSHSSWYQLFGLCSPCLIYFPHLKGKRMPPLWVCRKRRHTKKLVWDCREGRAPPKGRGGKPLSSTLVNPSHPVEPWWAMDQRQVGTELSDGPFEALSLCSQVPHEGLTELFMSIISVIISPLLHTSWPQWRCAVLIMSYKYLWEQTFNKAFSLTRL